MACAQVLQGLRMQVVAAMPAITIGRQHQAGGMTLENVQRDFHDKHAGEVQEAVAQLEQLLTAEQLYSKNAT